MSPTDPNAAHGGSWTGATGEAGPGGDVLRMLQEVEAQLAHLRQAEQRQRETQQALDRRAAEIEEALRHTEERRAALEAERQTIQHAAAELREREERLESRRNEFGAHASTLDLEKRRAATLAAEAEALRERLAAREERLAEREAMVEARTRDLDQRSTALDDRASGVTSELDRLRTELHHHDRERDALVRERDALHEESLRSAEALRTTKDQLHRLKEAYKEVSRRAAEGGGADTERLSQELAEARAEHERIEQELRARLDEARAELERAAHAKQPPKVIVGGERVHRRWDRLRRYRLAVRGRARKLRLANDVLRERIAACDGLLTQRRELAAAKRAIDETRGRVEAARARTSASASTFFVFATLILLGALSWLITGQFVPATYVASARIDAVAPDGAAVDEAQQTAWQQFHEELLMHPRLLERAAGRFQRRGMAELTKPEAVKAELEPVLAHASGRPGELSLEIVGEGRERTERVLETYVTALVAEANESRARRRDAFSTIIAEPARSGTEPVADPRPLYAAMGLGGATVVAAAVWFGLWGAMARRRAAFEASSKLDEILAESRWADPAPDVPRRPTGI